MAAKRGTVRTHTRMTKNGPVTVTQHSRSSRGRKSQRRSLRGKRGGRRALVSPRHAFMLARRAWSAWSRGRKAAALAVGALALLELGAWGALEGTALVAATAGVLAFGVAIIAGMATGRAR